MHRKRRRKRRDPSSQDDSNSDEEDHYEEPRRSSKFVILFVVIGLVWPVICGGVLWKELAPPTPDHDHKVMTFGCDPCANAMAGFVVKVLKPPNPEPDSPTD